MSAAMHSLARVGEQQRGVLTRPMEERGLVTLSQGVGAERWGVPVTLTQGCVWVVGGGGVDVTG